MLFSFLKSGNPLHNPEKQLMLHVCRSLHMACNVTFAAPFSFSVQAMESQIGDFYKDVGELGSLQGVCLPQRGLMAGDREGGEQSGVVETRIVRLIEPLKERRRILLASKEMHQVAQDLEDEIVSGLFFSLILFLFLYFLRVSVSSHIKVYGTCTNSCIYLIVVT